MVRHGVEQGLALRPPGQHGDRVAARVPLAEPRPLTAQERALLDYLLDGPLGRAELRRQAETARVVGLCSCGCASVWLGVDPATARADYDAAWVSIAAAQRAASGNTEVTLHVVEGHLHELEIWAGAYGVRARVDVAELEYERG